MAMISTRGSEWHKWDLHLHTASSYDSPYKAEDADELLCKALKENEISAVAITDHFKIDKDRIKHLRELEQDIVFFPGVELRTDKGANNLHLILIFSDESDIDTLSADFDAIMVRTNSKARESDETIYWLFEDIVEFCKAHNGLLSIHAGKKTNGMDKEISNALPVKEAIKAEIANSVDFFEVGRKQDIGDYHKHVFKVVDEKPIILCSDCHDPRNYTSKENLWIKGNLTFEGLKQCIYQPRERVYIGTIPPALDRVNKDKKVNMDVLSVHRIAEPKNEDVCWFDLELPLNSGLVAIIGNKGSGKSAFSDMIAQVCKCKTMRNASFLNENRFRKMPKNYAADYKAEIRWRDGHTEEMLLDSSDYGTTIEDAQYLPQKYIEEVCNDIGNIFQQEIDKVIFSYVDRTERGGASNLDELVARRSQDIKIEIAGVQLEIQELNKRIIILEKKKANQYQINIKDNLKKYEEILERHEKNKPTEIQKPVQNEKNHEYQENMKKVNLEIEQINSEIEKTKDELTEINVAISEAQQVIAKLQVLKTDFDAICELIENFVSKYQLDGIIDRLELKLPVDIITTYKNKLMTDKLVKQMTINGSEVTKGLNEKLEEAQEKKKELISTTDIEEKRYQKYLQDLQEWEKEREKIIGDNENEECLTYLRTELNYLENELDDEYATVREKRDSKFRELCLLKKKLVSVYEEIYSPVESEIKKLLGDLEETIEFEAEMQLTQDDFSESILSHISLKHAGIFKGRTEASNKMSKLLRQTEFDNEESVLELVKSIMVAVDEDIDNSEKKIADKQSFYDYLYGLDYLGVSFKLKMGGRNLEELSPGERGIVLLIFYLALSQNSIPIIIDQPEDNLDNQSVYNKLVPCICAAKQKRQVIIVTHNPNIAVACDAEQIICCQMNKNTYNIKYISGAIEDDTIKKCVVDILEGTMPAFDLRRKKYV
jgi:ABC-type cobalamin/Fe3+-siderophores transport system ATPase subunit